MVPKKPFQIPAWSISLELTGLPERKISKTLQKEAEAFKERNSIVIVGHEIKTKKPIHKCCQSCLKAHLIKKAESLGLDRDLRELLFSMVEYETGHYGYYKDQDKLIRI
jgi:hypothetical protein